MPDSKSSSGSGRFVEGLNAIVYTAVPPGEPASAPRQAFLYSFGTNTTQQLTTDPDSKGPIFMWRAPERGNKYVFFVTVDTTPDSGTQDVQGIRFYEQDDQGVWTSIGTALPPASAPKRIWSAESFAYGNHSYVFMERNEASSVDDELTLPSQIWLVGLDLTQKELSGPTAVTRNDPEWFPLPTGPVIYYNEYLPSDAGGASPSVFNGVWYSPTGIAPAP